MPENPMLMAAAWNSFAAFVIPPDTPAVQRQEMRRAFYAGAQAFLGIQLRELQPGEDETPEDLALMDHLDAELQQFARDVIGGRA